MLLNSENGWKKTVMARLLTIFDKSHGFKNRKNKILKQACAMPHTPKLHNAFSLVEMLMALLVASLLLVALAPVMTKRATETLSVSGIGGSRADYKRTWYYDQDKEFLEWTVPNGVNMIKITSIGGGGAGGGASFGSREFTTDTEWTVPEGVTKIRIFMTAGGGAGASGGPGKDTIYADIGTASGNSGDIVSNTTWDISKTTAYRNIPELPQLCKDSGVTAWTLKSDVTKNNLTPLGSYVKIQACGGGGGAGGGGCYDLGGGGGSGGKYEDNLVLPTNQSSYKIWIGGGGGGGAGDNEVGQAGLSFGGGSGGSGDFGNTRASIKSSSQKPSSWLESYWPFGSGGYLQNGVNYGGTGGGGGIGPNADGSGGGSDGDSGANLNYFATLYGGAGQAVGSKRAGNGGDSISKKTTSYGPGGAGGGGSVLAGGGGGGAGGGSGGGGGGPTWIEINGHGYDIVAPGGGGGGGGGCDSSGGTNNGGGGGGGGGLGGGDGGDAGDRAVNSGQGKSGKQGSGGNSGVGINGGKSPFESGTAAKYCAGGQAASATWKNGANGQSGWMKISWSYMEKALQCEYTQTTNGAGGGGAGQVWFGEMSVTPGQTLSIKVGKGGEPSTNYGGKGTDKGNGGNGEDTSVGTITVKGGLGGQYISNNANIALSAGEGQGYRSTGLVNWNTAKITNEQFETLKTKMGKSGGQGHLVNDATKKAAGGDGGSTIDRNGNELQGANAGNAGSKGTDATKYGTGGGGGGGVTVRGNNPGLGGKGAQGYVYIEWGSANGGGGGTGQVIQPQTVWVTPNTVAKIYVGKGGVAKELKELTSGTAPATVTEGKLGQDGEDGGDSYVLYKADNQEKKGGLAKGGKGGIAGTTVLGRGGGIKLDSTGKYDPDDIKPEIENTVAGETATVDRGGMGGTITEAMCPLLTELKKIGLGGCGGNTTTAGACLNAVFTSGEGVTAGGIGNGGGGGAVVNNTPGKGGNGSGGMVTIEWNN